MAQSKPLYQRTWFIIVMAVLLLAIVAGSLGNSGDESQDTKAEEATSLVEPSPSESISTVTESATPEPTESAETSPLDDPDSAENKGYFVSSANGDLADLDKDINDAIKRANADQKIRLLGNILEFSFNLGQLEILTAPTSVKAQWDAGLIKLESRISGASDAASEFVSEERSTSQMVAAIESVRSQVDALKSIVAKTK